MVRIYSGNLASVLEARPNGELVIKLVGGDDYYRLVLWPAPSQPPRLLKRHTIDQLRT